MLRRNPAGRRSVTWRTLPASLSASASPSRAASLQTGVQLFAQLLMVNHSDSSVGELSLNCRCSSPTSALLTWPVVVARHCAKATTGERHACVAFGQARR